MTNIIMIKWLKLKFQMEVICKENIDPLISSSSRGRL